TSGEPAGLTVSQLQLCLAALPTDLHYDDWLMVGMAIHCETQGQGFELWEEWSATSGKYTTREYNEERWRSFGKGGGTQVTGRSLVHLANEHGARISLNSPASAEEFESLVDDVQDLDATAKPPRYLFEPVHTFSSTQALPWIIKGVLPKAGLGVVYGASGSGKSFAVLDMSMAIARGCDWRGKRVRQGRVAYIAAEGADGFRKRLAAYAMHHQVDLAQVPMTVLNAAPNLMEKQDAVDVAKGIKASGGADLIVIDTFAQTTPGANENAGEDVGKALGYCKRIHEATGAMVLLIHHSGKDATKGARGWSGLRAAADAEIEVVREATGRYLRLTKSKDGEDGLEWGFDLEVVQVDVDEDLDPVTSCVVIEAQMPVVGAGPARKLGVVEKVVNEVIQEFALAQTEGIEVGPVLAEAIKRMDPPADGKRDTRRMRARKALESLCAGDEAPYWLADDGCIAVC
ncbi:MAG: AAA family ATPase, partial [Rubrivivax sp.]